MNIGMIGLGKLGLPVAVAIARKEFNVMGYDLDPSRMSKEPQPYQETGPDGTGDFNDYLAVSNITFGTMQEVADHADIVFVAVQTPHDPLYEGITQMPDKRVDFDYTYLKAAISALAKCVKKETVVAVISTCLPGTMRREIMPLLNDNMKLVYNPAFIAMGTTMRDFKECEFVLLGSDDKRDYKENAVEKIVKFYSEAVKSSIRIMSIESAELTKVLYNTYISLKIAYANTVMEICEKIPRADVDSVTDAIKAAYTRLISRQYLSGGMGDGGGCHPRDNIAMSWLSRELGLSYDLFESAMLSREGQARWLADIVIDKSHDDMPIVILGYAFKPETNLIVGSHALLVADMINRDGYNVTLIDNNVIPIDEPLKKAVYLIGCKHKEYFGYVFPRGSIIIDPHRYIPDQEDITVIRLGEATC